jgi:hypothetical protein
LAITHASNGETILVCRVHDQAALHGLLTQLFALNLTLLAVERQERRPAAIESVGRHLTISARSPY